MLLQVHVDSYVISATVLGRRRNHTAIMSGFLPLLPDESLKDILTEGCVCVCVTCVHTCAHTRANIDVVLRIKPRAWCMLGKYYTI